MTQTYEPAHDPRTDALEPPSLPEQAEMANDKPSNTNRITVFLAMHALRRPASYNCVKVTSDIGHHYARAQEGGPICMRPERGRGGRNRPRRAPTLRRGYEALSQRGQHAKVVRRQSGCGRGGTLIREATAARGRARHLGALKRPFFTPQNTWSALSAMPFGELCPEAIVMTGPPVSARFLTVPAAPFVQYR